MNPAHNTAGGRLAGSLFFAVFLISGLIFAGLVVWPMHGRFVPYTWNEARATILSSVIAAGNLKEEESPFHATIRFRYTSGGREYVAQHHASSAEYQEMQRLVDRYPPGTAASCRVNPESPAKAVLEPPSLWIALNRTLPGTALLLLLPVVFVAIGAGGLLWFRKSRRAQADTSLDVTSGALRVRHGMLPMLYVFFSIFTLAGALTLYSFLIKPSIRTISAYSWTERPCTIIAGRVRTSNRDSEYATFSVDILYSYEVNGRGYKSNRYDFSTASESFINEKAEAVNRYPPGSTSVCYVNPSDPYDSVLKRRFDYGVDDVVQTLLFLLGGLAGLIFLIPAVKRAQSRRQTPNLDL